MSKFNEYFEKAQNYQEDIPPTIDFETKIKTLLEKGDHDAAMEIAVEHFLTTHKDPDDAEKAAEKYINGIKK